MAANSTDRILSSEANIFTAGDNMLRILWNSKVNWLLQKNSPLVCILSKMNPFYSLDSTLRIFKYYPHIYALTNQVTSPSGSFTKILSHFPPILSSFIQPSQ
jgi:hypothetical protein